MSTFSGLKGPSFLPELEGPGKLQFFRDKPDEDGDPNRRIIVTFGNRHAIRYDLEDNSVVTGYYCPTFLTLSTPVAYDASIASYVCGVNSGKQLVIWDGKESKLENILNAEIHNKSKAQDHWSSLRSQHNNAAQSHYTNKQRENNPHHTSLHHHQKSQCT